MPSLRATSAHPTTILATVGVHRAPAACCCPRRRDTDARLFAIVGDGVRSGPGAALRESSANGGSIAVRRSIDAPHCAASRREASAVTLRERHTIRHPASLRGGSAVRRSGAVVEQPSCVRTASPCSAARVVRRGRARVFVRRSPRGKRTGERRPARGPTVASASDREGEAPRTRTAFGAQFHEPVRSRERGSRSRLRRDPSDTARPDALTRAWRGRVTRPRRVRAQFRVVEVLRAIGAPVGRPHPPRGVGRARGLVATASQPAPSPTHLACRSSRPLARATADRALRAARRCRARAVRGEQARPRVE